MRNARAIIRTSLVTGLAAILALSLGSVPLRASADDGVWGWGGGMGPASGTTGFANSNSVPTHVNGLSSILAVAAGSEHNLALLANGTVKAWGRNASGQLGDGTLINRTDPVSVSGLSGVIAIAGGGAHSLALKSDGTVWGWGNNNGGQLANPVGTKARTPVQAQGISDVSAIAAGYSHGLALKTDGTVWAWGENYHGELGNGTTGGYNAVPGQVQGLTDVVAIACGNYHSLAVKSDGTVWAWGYGNEGRLGTGTTDDSNVPLQVGGLGTVVKAAAGGAHNLVLLNDGTVWGWGRNDHGQLGNGTYTLALPYWTDSPTQVSGLTGVTTIECGEMHSLALRSDGTVWAWGNYTGGALGVGPSGNPPYGSANPLQVAVITGVTAIAAGAYQSVAIGPYGTQDTTVTVANVEGHPGDTVPISATLTRNSDGTPLSGRWMTFMLGTKVLGVAATNGSGTAGGTYKIPASYPAPGTQTITAKFGGDPDYRVSSGTGTLTIKVGSSLALTMSPSSPQYGANVTATAKLKSGASPLVGYPVYFFLDNVELASSPVNTDATGTAVLVFTAPHPGAHSLKAAFDASAPYPAAQAGPISFTVKKATTKLTGESKSAPAGSSVNIGAVLTRALDGTPLVGKTVTFKVGTTLVTATTDGTGRASINVTAPAAGVTKTYGVTFAADADYSATSGSVSVTGT